MRKTSLLPRNPCAVLCLSSIFGLALSFSSITAPAQPQRSQAAPPAASAPTAIPALVPYSGVALGADGSPLLGEVSITLLIYKDEEGGGPLWMESQVAVVDSIGRYKVQMGAANPNGLPSDLFATGEARWLEVQIAGQPKQPRVLLASVPYALKAADSATLGGLPASAFALAGSNALANSAFASAITPDAATTVMTTGGTANKLAKFSGGSTIVNSIIYDNGTDVGIGTTAPTATLDVDGSGLFTGGITTDAGSTLGGYVYLPPTGTATASKGYSSAYLKLSTSVYNSSSKTVLSPRFQLQAEDQANNSSAPTATLALAASNTNTAPADTGLYFNTNGTIHFAPGQTFPGTGTGSGTITGVAAGTGLTGGGTSGNVTLNLNTATIPTLSGNNTYTGSNIFKPSLYTDTDMNIDNTNANAGNISPGLRLGSGSGEGMASKRTSGGNQYGVDIYTDYQPRLSVNAAGQVAIGTGATFDGSQLQVQGGTSTGGEFTGGSMFESGDSIGQTGILAMGGNGANSANPEAGAGITATGGNATGSGSGGFTEGGDGGVFQGGTASNASCCYEGGPGGDSPAPLPFTGSGIVAMGGFASSGQPGYGAVLIGGSTNTGTPQAGLYVISGTDENSNQAGSADFNGDVTVTGDVNVSGNVNAEMDDSVIDHPGDPANKYLVHSSIQSSEMVNIYSGNVTTDELGLATVKLPEWFEVENGDFRYQLTSIGRDAHAWIAEKIANHQFKIATNATHVEVSWQVTGVRQDAYAKAHPLVVEKAKPASERGFYMHPELYGQPKEKQTEWGRHPQIMRRTQSTRDAQKTKLNSLHNPVAQSQAVNASR